MKLISYRSGTKTGVGVMTDERRFVALSERAPELPLTLRGILEEGDQALARVREAASAPPDHNVDDVELLPVVPDPPAIWCVGVNYDEHRQETGPRARWGIASRWFDPGSPKSSTTKASSRW
jgi:2-keto-4-pentenoate hydratase/2-oxohepta-3-ene-1,7-dioic acid hydratase in catechol pathway